MWKEPWNSTLFPNNKNYLCACLMFDDVRLLFLLLCLFFCFLMFPQISAKLYVCLVSMCVSFCMCCWLNAWFNEVSVMMISILKTHFARFQLTFVKKFRSYLMHYPILMAFPNQFRFCLFPRSISCNYVYFDFITLSICMLYTLWVCSCCCCFSRFVICSPCLPTDYAIAYAQKTHDSTEVKNKFKSMKLKSFYS